MDIQASLSQFQSSIKRISDQGSAATRLLQTAPEHMQSKAYRDAYISNNMFKKSLQLYNDLSRLNGLTNSSALNAPDYRAAIEEKGLEAVLQSYIKHNQNQISTTLRGEAFDVKN